MKLINTVAYILIKQKRILLVRPKSKNVYYMPGGKLEKGETSIVGLLREVKEELRIELIPKSIAYYGTLKDQAYGKEKGIEVSIECYTGKYDGEPTPTSEIEEVRYFTSKEYLNMEETAPAVRLIVKSLKNEKLIY